MSRIELPPGARPFVPQRDLLVGGPSDQRRHVLARVALVGRLLREPLVRDAFDTWATRHGFREPLETLTTRLDTLAIEAGLSSRTALFAPESTLDASTQTARHEAFEAFWNDLTGSAAELVQDGRRLAERLVTALRLSDLCGPWLTVELLSWFFDSLRAQIEDRAVTRRYTENPFPDVVALRGDPRLSARQRMPNHGGQHIATYVERLVQNGLHGASVRTLGRAQLRSEGGLRSPNYDGRHRIQYGKSQARRWLAAVARIPESRPPRPRRRTTKKRSTQRRRRRSPPR